MAGKIKKVNLCQSCGANFPKWSGQCSDCGEWNSIHEQAVKPRSQERYAHMTGSKSKSVDNSVQTLGDIKQISHARITTGIGELDRVMGGGLVKGSVTLIGGDPGIGKSTLLLQALAGLSDQVNVLYASGEESVEQVGLRATRLTLQAPKLKLVAENHLETILGLVQTHDPDVLVIDSIQTIYSEELASAPGSVSQVRDCSAQFVRMAKQSGCAVILVGHVTKDGNIAGPRILEHMVDSVLYFEGDRQTSFRIIRGIKIVLVRLMKWVYLPCLILV
jgi:DNA replication and repair protein RadA